jgi:hypothetical protein
MAHNCASDFVEVPKDLADKYSVWLHFLRSKDGKSGKCKNSKCSKILKCTKGNTTGLRKHAESVHGIKFEKGFRPQPAGEKSGTINNTNPGSTLIASSI